MVERRGEKVGWIGGFIGGFIWVFVLAIVFIVQGKTLEGLSGLALSLLSLASIFYFSPWRHPNTTYRRLMLPLYSLFYLSILWVFLSYGGLSALRELQLNWYNSLWLLFILPTLIPFWSNFARLKWNREP